MEGNIYRISKVLPNGYGIRYDEFLWDFVEDSLQAVYDQF